MYTLPVYCNAATIIILEVVGSNMIFKCVSKAMEVNQGALFFLERLTTHALLTFCPFSTTFILLQSFHVSSVAVYFAHNQPE